jgi:hypothetical protein
MELRWDSVLKLAAFGVSIIDGCIEREEKI